VAADRSAAFTEAVKEWQAAENGMARRIEECCSEEGGGYDRKVGEVAD
jgi:hypothetical protein